MSMLSRLSSSGGATPTYVEDVFSMNLYTNTSDATRFPIKTDVGFISTDEWHSNVLLNSGSARGCVCAYDSSGNYYLTGGSASSVFVLAKYNSQGSTIWIRDITSTGSLDLDNTITKIKVTNSGDIYLVGNKSGTIFVIKINSSGGVVWTREFAPVAYSPGYVYMDMDSSENIHVVYTDNTFKLSYFVLNSSGTIDSSKSKTISIQQDASAQNILGSMRLDSSGNVYVCGSINLPSTGFYYGYALKLNSSLQVQWYRSINKSEGVPKFNALDIDASGNVYVTGVLRGSVYDELYVEKLNSSGVSQWSKVIQVTGGSAAGIDIKIDSEGNVYVTSRGSDYSWIIVKLNNSGASLWQKKVYSTTYANYTQPYSLDIDSNNNLYVSGNTNETTGANTHRYQIYKISQSGESFGITPYSTLASRTSFGDYTVTNSVISGVGTHTFVVSSATITPTTVTYTSATSTIVNQFISIPAKKNNGGLLWLKSRSAAGSHLLPVTESSYLNTNTSGAQYSLSESNSGTVNSLSSNGFLVQTNSTTNTASAWTFRKAPKFFDVVTYTGDGVSGRTVAHNLGSIPGCMIIKRLDSTSNWPTYHRSLSSPQNNAVLLNLTNAALGAGFWTANPTDTVFSLSSDADVNVNGGTYIAYLFAHDAGGFGDDGTENVISCGSFTPDGSGNATVTLGWEPQWVLWKSSTSSDLWQITDNMRGWANASGGRNFLQAQSSSAETAGNEGFPTATGFEVRSASGAQTYIYIAIRRGPMKTPTTGTEVFEPVLNSGNETTKSIGSAAFPVDLLIAPARTGSSISRYVSDRLRGRLPFLVTSSTDAEANFSAAYGVGFDQQSGVTLYISTNNVNSHTYVNYALRRAPGFFDVVCYTGTGTTPGAFEHNLGVAPEMVIVKSRNLSVQDWRVRPFNYSTIGGALSLNSTAAPSIGGFGGAGSPTSTYFYVSPSSTPNNMNSSGATYVAYLFATCPGVSKVGSYTGNGTSQTIDCGFTTGARFVLIKRTDSTGDWYVWDSARGIVAGNDPYLLLNSTAAEVTSTDYIDLYSAGFEISSTAPAAINASGGNYIFLAIA